MSDLNQLAIDLHRTGKEIEEASRRVVKASSEKIKRQAKQFSSGIAHAARYPRSITYNVTRDRLGWQGEIGPNDTAQNQGFLGYIYEFGNATTPPNAHLGPALDREGPEFEKAMLDAALAVDALTMRDPSKAVQQ